MKRTWYPLDNAAKIYPPVSNSRRGGMFSLSARLDHEVEPTILLEAVNVVLERFPSFKVKLKRGVFWYYLEENTKQFKIEQEEAYFMRFVGELHQNNDYLFRVMYRQNKITICFFHCLCDGTGGLNFFKSLLAEYLTLKGFDIKTEGLVINEYSPHTMDEVEDTFLREFRKPKIKTPKQVDAFKPDGTPFDSDGCGIITGKVPISKFKSLAKSYDVTISEYISALYMYCIYKECIKNRKVKNKNVTILVPVNMRKVYPSETMRNFALFARLTHNWEKEVSFEDCIKLCKRQLRSGVEKDKLDAIIYSNVKAEKNIVLKIMPLFIKDIAMRIAYRHVGDNLHTANMSNLGLVDLPESMSEHIQDIVFNLGTSYSTKIHVAVIGYKQNLYISFSRAFVENKIEREFFRTLSSLGVDVTLFSNFWEEKL